MTTSDYVVGDMFYAMWAWTVRTYPYLKPLDDDSSDLANHYKHQILASTSEIDQQRLFVMYEQDASSTKTELDMQRRQLEEIKKAKEAIQVQVTEDMSAEKLEQVLDQWVEDMLNQHGI